ncbi:hypothetical protein THAOC_18328, partial [Thalassiosira oceanica]
MERRGEQRLAEGDLTFDKTTPWTSVANNRPGSRREQVERHNSQTYDAPPLGPPTSAATPGPPVPLLAGGTERLRGMATSGYHRLRSPGAGAAPSLRKYGRGRNSRRKDEGESESGDYAPESSKRRREKSEGRLSGRARPSSVRSAVPSSPPRSSLSGKGGRRWVRRTSRHAKFIRELDSVSLARQLILGAFALAPGGKLLKCLAVHAGL